MVIESATANVPCTRGQVSLQAAKERFNNRQKVIESPVRDISGLSWLEGREDTLRSSRTDAEKGSFEISSLSMHLTKNCLKKDYSTNNE